METNPAACFVVLYTCCSKSANTILDQLAYQYKDSSAQKLHLLLAFRFTPELILFCGQKYFQKAKLIHFKGSL